MKVGIRRLKMERAEPFQEVGQSFNVLTSTLLRREFGLLECGYDFAVNFNSTSDHSRRMADVKGNGAEDNRMMREFSGGLNRESTQVHHPSSSY
jgi:hypothetical protein